MAVTAIDLATELVDAFDVYTVSGGNTINGYDGSAHVDAVEMSSTSYAGSEDNEAALHVSMSDGSRFKITVEVA